MSTSNQTPTHSNISPDLPPEPVPIPADLTPLSADELRELIYRLQQHQAELEKQNELLRQTQRQTAEQELKPGLFQEQDIAKSLIEMAQVIILVLDLEGKIVYFNSYLEQLSGFSLVEVQGRDWFTTFLPQREWSRIRKRFAQAISDKQTWGNINPIVTKQAEEREIEWYDVTLKDTLGNVTGLLAIGYDITEHRQTQAALRNNEELFRQLAENIHEVFFVRDLEQNRMIYVSPVYETVWGRSRKELYQDPRSFLASVHPEDEDRVMAALIRQNQGGEYFNEEYRILHPDGTTHWVWARTFPVRDETGRVYRLAGLVEDVTKWKRAEAALHQVQQELEQLVENRTANLQETNRLLREQIEERKRVETQLRLSEERLRAQFDGFPIPTYTWQHQGDNIVLIDYNYAAELITQGEIVNYLGWTLTRMYGHLPEIQADFWQCLREKTALRREMDYPFRSTGETRVLNVHYVFVPPDLVQVHTEDITERTQAEEALRKSESNLSEAQRIAHLGSWEWDLRTEKLYWSDEVYRIFGVKSQEFVSSYEVFLQFVHPDDQETVQEAVGRAIDANEPYQLDHRIVHPDGTTRIVHEQAEIIFDKQGQPLRMVGTVHDLTEQKLAEEQIKASLKEKEVLLKEIHHRVKNNLQVVVSLLKFQSRYVDDERVVNLLRESQNRVKSMALIHEKLYQSPNLTQINYADYLRSLIHHLFQSYPLQSRPIALNLELEELFLEVGAGFSCGLIVNELVSNALKHAFPTEESQQHGEIYVKLHIQEDRHVILRVRDNGVGFPAGLDFRNTDSLGLQLVMMLVEQLEGTIQMTRQPDGAEFLVSFVKIT